MTINVEKYAKELDEIVADVRTLANKVQNSTGFKLENVAGTINSLMDRFCPFDVGDSVKLTTDFTCDKDHGWHSYQHFLVEGAEAKITERGYDYKANRFEFYLKFENETRRGYIDKIEHPVTTESKHVFQFTEDWITNVSKSNDEDEDGS